MDDRVQNKAKQILKCLTEWNWLHIHGDVKELLNLKSASSTVTVEFCTEFLITSGKCLANGFDLNLVQITGLKQLINAVKACHEFLLVEKTYVNFGNLVVLRWLYHILQHTFPLDHRIGLDVSDQLLKELDIYVKCNPSAIDVPKDVTSVLKNTYLLLWNGAQTFDNDGVPENRHNHVLDLRARALQFLHMASDCIRFCVQATRASVEYQKFLKSHPCSHMDSFYANVSPLLLQMITLKAECASSSDAPKLLNNCFNFLLIWLNYLLPRGLAPEAEKAIMDFNESICIYLKKYSPKLLETISFCTGILLFSTHLCQIASEDKSPLTTDLKALIKQHQSFDKMAQEFRPSWENCMGKFIEQLRNLHKRMQVNPGLAKTVSLHLMDLKYVIGHIVACRILSSSEISSIMTSTFVNGDLGYCCGLHQTLLSICAIALDNLDKTSVQFSATVMAAMDIADQFSQLVKDCHHSYGNYYVASIYPICLMCFNKKLYSEALKFYKTCWKFIKKSIIAEDSEHTWKVYSKYIANANSCFCNERDYLGALTFLAEMMSASNKHNKELIEQWVKVKRCVKSFSPGDKILSTTVKLLSTFESKFKKKDLVSLLMQEFEAYRNYDAQEEMLAVIKDLLCEKKSMDDLSKAVVLVYYAELQLTTGIDPYRSPRACCNEAIQLLEKLDMLQSKKPFPSENHCWLAHAFFVLHLFEKRENEAASEAVVINQSNSLAAATKRNSEETYFKCNVSPAYLHITVEVEFNFLFYLDKSLDIWTSIVSTKPNNVADPIIAINDLKTMAEMYSVVRMVSREVQAWKLVLEVAKSFSNPLEWGNAVARLVSLLSRNGLTREASMILEEFKQLISELECKSQPNCKLSQVVVISLLLAESELLLMKNKVVEGWEYLLKVRHNLISSRASDLITILQCEANLLSSKFTELPPSNLMLNSDSEDSPIVFAARSLTSCMTLVKSISKKDFKSSKCMELKPRVINLLMECALRVGYLFQDVGAPRESRCFLMEQLIWAQKLSLANRSAELLLALSKLDIISGHYDDCQSKLHGVKFIIESPGKQLQINPNAVPCHLNNDGSSESIPEDQSDFISPCSLRKNMAEQSEDSKTCSPVMKNRAIFLNWQQHSSSCLCTKCKQIVFHRLRLELAFALIECQFYSNNFGRNKIIESMSTILSYAETWRKIEYSLLLEMASNLKPTMLKGSKKANAERPLLQLDFIICHALCKLAQMRMHNDDLNGSHLAIKSAYSKVSSLTHIGLAQTHYLLADVIYYYCLVKLNLIAKRRGLSTLQLLSQNVWNISETAFSGSTAANDVDYLTAKIDTVHIFDNGKLTDCFKTPRNLVAPMPKRNSSFIKDAPIKKISTLSAFENQFSDSDSQSQTPIKPPRSKRIGPKKSARKREEKIDATVDKAMPERRIIPKKSLFPKLSTIDDRENSDVDLKSPVKKATDGRLVLGSFCNGNFKNVANAGQIDVPVITLDSTSSPETNLPFISASKIQKAPKVAPSRNKFGIASFATSFQTETVRRSLRCKTRSTSLTSSSSPNTTEVTWSSDLDDVAAFPSENFPFLPADSILATFTTADSVSTYGSVDTKMGKSLHLLINELETLRGSSPNALTAQKTKTSKMKSPLKRRSITMPKNNDLPIEKVIILLEKAVKLTRHHPHMPLYSDLNLLLTLCKGENDSSNAYNIFESIAVTLRHQANYILAVKLNNLSCQGDKGLNNPNADKSRLKERQELLAFSRSNVEDNAEVDLISRKINEEWTVCQINAVPSFLQNDSHCKNCNPELIITRLRPNCKPLIVKTLTMASLDGVNNFCSEFDSIVKESTIGARLTDRSLWWSRRREVDNRLKALVKSMEDHWLGPWKGLLLGNPTQKDDRQKLKEITNFLAKEITSRGFQNFNDGLLEVIVNSYSFLEDSLPRQALAAMLHISCDDKRIKELCMTFKKQCARLCSDIIQRQHVILILEKELQKFPWENMPILRGVPVSRMPSIHFLLAHMALYRESYSSERPMVTVDTSKAYYVLNPGNDLPATEKLLSVTFNSLNWNGVTGRPPTMEEWSSALSDHDLFLYNGHGSGMQYVSVNSILKSSCKACVFLIGCSSGKLKSQGRRLELDGVVLHYLLAGSPLVVGNLWDVTDKAIDKFLDDLLKYWLPGPSQSDSALCRAIISARVDCNLHYAIGAAPVTYGIPIQAKIR